ncbi:hypothetical protein F0562_006772 [Nyssa sinensis]|uniref:Uncharacterized protein n=1 Tax=Nyssa sinensis TaxID=561372 RepID=A0A5J5AQM7_9ASTE|nr:hypothetical protein F0562_006772 [Nyssa sinensis]
MGPAHWTVNACTRLTNSSVPVFFQGSSVLRQSLVPLSIDLIAGEPTSICRVRVLKLELFGEEKEGPVFIHR